MEFRILGPLEVLDEDRLVDVGGPKQRALLAILLLHANEIVSPDTLIDELWGDAPPPTAVRTLHAHVSRLRKALDGKDDPSERDGGPVEARGHGYVLTVEPGQLDVDSFQRLLEDARRALARGEAQAAAENADKALALWRGPALADLAYESFAQAEIARLEELRLAALEERVEAHLALGRHRELVGELEALVARHPLRERLRGQLMLALYRSDRQAEALEVYQQGRHALAEELGLEPSQALQRLERQILEQDPAIAPPARGERPWNVPARAGRVPRLIFLAAALVFAAAVGAAIFQLARDGGGAATRGSERAIDRSGLGVLDPRTGELLDNIPLGTAPSTVAVGDGDVWVLDADDRTVSRIDPEERRVIRTFSTASTPTDVAAGAGAVWIGNGARGFGSFPVSVSRVDAESGVVEETVPLPGTGGKSYFHGGGETRRFIAVTGDAVWVVNPDQTLSRIDPRTNRVVARITAIRASSIAAGDGEVWGVVEAGVAKIDPASNAVARRIEVAAESLTGLAVGEGAVWAVDPFGGSVWRIDPGPEPLMRTIPLDFGVGSVAFGEGAVWATNEIADKVYRIDPGTNRARVVSRAAAPGGVAVGEGAVWVTAAGRASADAALPASVCREPFYRGRGVPRFLVVSDLPLQGVHREIAPMVEAIRFVFEQRGFKAGPYSVGYQSCDDSTAQAGGTDVHRCFSNAKAYARTREVVGIIGAFHSFCSIFQIPVANQAPDGPLAMISPSNTFIGLTREPRALAPGWPAFEDLYPTGERNYVRIAAADHLQAVALVQAAKELGRRRLFLAWDRDDADTAGFAADMRNAARRMRLQIVGAGAWNPHARNFTPFARNIATERPEAVLMTGAAPPHVGTLIRDLRAELGYDVALIASDGFADFPSLIEAAGPAATGMYVGYYGIPNGALPPAGRRFLQAFEASRGGEPSPDFSATYGAQAAEILLDAIARSDGTRTSVTRELFRTTVEDGILGDIRFDEHGDLVEGPFTIYRVAGKRPVVDRVVTVSAPTR